MAIVLKTNCRGRRSRKMSWEAIVIIHKEETMVTHTQAVSVEATRKGQIVGII